MQMRTAHSTDGRGHRSMSHSGNRCVLSESDDDDTPGPGPPKFFRVIYTGIIVIEAINLSVFFYY